MEYGRHDFLTANQSQCGWAAPTDRYYFNIARSLPMVSGLGRYHALGLPCSTNRSSLRWPARGDYKVQPTVGPFGNDFEYNASHSAAASNILLVVGFHRAQIADRNINYGNATPQFRAVEITFLASNRLQHPFLPIVDLNMLNGTLAAHHRAVIVCGVRHLDPAVVTASEQCLA